MSKSDFVQMGLNISGLAAAMIVIRDMEISV